MSGHSHFKTIKAQKEVADAKRGKIFSKMGKIVSIAAKNGADPTTNPKLRIAIEQARNVNMPKENIERAILRGTGELAGDNLEEVVFEGFGPGGIAIIIEAITDNKNRTLGEIKQILSQNNSKLAGEGAVQWMFERKGIIVINTKDQGRDIKKEDLELTIIESGADDISWQEDILGVYTKPDSVDLVKKALESNGVKIDSTTTGLIPKDTVAVDEKTRQNCQKLFDALEDNDAVQETYSNLAD